MPLIIALMFLVAGISTPGQSSSLTERSSLTHHRTQERRAHSAQINCLPSGTKLDDVVSYGAKGRGTVTVQQKLAELKARCKNRKLVDYRGREIRFFRTSCWGNPPADYREIQQRQNEELQKLQKRYAVIVFGCNPMIQ
ncbi:MAG TPA: hypothetical protein VGJ55_00820 [Pyrinomonadaceae bacterium]|jgi:hypothetical protein